MAIQAAPDFLSGKLGRDFPQSNQPTTSPSNGSCPTHTTTESDGSVRRNSRSCSGFAPTANSSRVSILSAGHTTVRSSFAVSYARTKGLEHRWVGRQPIVKSPSAACRTRRFPFSVRGRFSSVPSHSWGSNAMPWRIRIQFILAPFLSGMNLPHRNCAVNTSFTL